MKIAILCVLILLLLILLMFLISFLRKIKEKIAHKIKLIEHANDSKFLQLTHVPKEESPTEVINEAVLLPPPNAAQQEKLYSERLNSFLRIENIPKEMAEDFVRHSAFWDHPSGQYVRARKHAKNLKSGYRGWTLPLGANDVLVGKAIERCQKLLKKYTENINSGIEVANRDKLFSAFKMEISCSVANHAGYEYTSGYSSSANGYMFFGTQIISLNDAAKFIFDTSDAESLFK